MNDQEISYDDMRALAEAWSLLRSRIATSVLRQAAEDLPFEMPAAKAELERMADDYEAEEATR